MANNTFPNAYINLKDNSVQTVPDPTVLPIHLPLFASFAETGPVGVPIMGGTNALKAVYGSGFLNERSPYFSHPNVFIEHALAFQQIYMVRVADPAATAASLVLMCSVMPGPIIQYTRTTNGALIYNTTTGLPIPAVEVDGVTVITQPGVTLTYSLRPLASGETLDAVATTTVLAGGITTVNYPLMAFSTYVGAAGNNFGFRLFYNASFDVSAVDNINAMIYSFQPVALNGTTNVESPIYDIYNSQTQSFAFAPGAYDSSTAMYYDLNEQITNNFNGLSGLPYQFYVYGSNAGLIGEAVLAVSTELAGTNPYLINILSGIDQNTNPYEHMVVSSGSVSILNSNAVDYLQGGTDGSLSNATLEAQTTQLMSGELNPLIGDSFRFPFTHIYDSGYTLLTKQALLNIFAIRDDVGVELSTQDVSLPANTAAMDQSTGSALRTLALLTPESVDFGTQTCRVSIYQQCGTLSDTQVYIKIVPATLDRMIKRCMYNGTDHVTGEPKGRPNSEVSIFNIASLNWTPTGQQQQQKSWSTGLNYIQYCDIATLFYADLLSVYPIDSSLLSSSVLCDYAAIYLKKIIRKQWTIIVGRDDPPTSLFAKIATAIDADAAYVFNGNIATSTVVSQTAVDTALGYQLTVTTTVLGSPTNRVWQVIVPIQRAA
jgi:hypothetical protein